MLLSRIKVDRLPGFAVPGPWLCGGREERYTTMLDQEYTMLDQKSANINELLPGCNAWTTHCGVAGGLSDEQDMEDDGESSIRRHPASSLLFLPNQEARAWAIVEEIKRGVSEGDFHLRTRTAVHALKRHLDLKRSVSPDARVVVIKILYSSITDVEDLDQMLQRFVLQQM